MIIQGKLHLQLMKGPSLLFLDDEPLAKKLNPYDGKQVLVTFKLPNVEKKVNGIAGIFYFEGKDGYGGDKFTNDFDIEEFDCIEWLSNFDGNQVTIFIE
ncbi:hypothetical protein ACIQ4I_05250 [Rummeliibacillus sp. NPDC094406]|uniref:hypothetical protein n=1 Tax=Rummeliibacillus sp. NPDC094406 TaxID=3364511 RepID=UPI0037F3811F